MQKKNEKVARMFLLADPHIGSRRSPDINLIRGLQNMQKIDPNAVLIIDGDLTTSGRIEDFNRFWSILEENISKGTEKVISLGNHDVRGPLNKNWTSNPNDDTKYFNDKVKPNYQNHYLSNHSHLYFSKIINGCNMIVLNPEKGLKDAIFLSTQQLNWLESQLQLSEQEGLLSLIIVHQALNDTHWRSNYAGGFGSQDTQVKEILKRHPNCFVFSGHIHNGLGVCEAITRDFGTLIDLPAYAISENGYSGQSVGYYLQISKEWLEFQAWDFSVMEHLTQFDFRIPTVTLASTLNTTKNINAVKEGTALMNRYYNQDRYNDSITENYVGPPERELYGPKTWKEIENIILTQKNIAD